MENVIIRELNQKNATEKASLISVVNLSFSSPDYWTSEPQVVTGPRLTAKRLEEYFEEEWKVLVAVQADNGIVGGVKAGVTERTLSGNRLERPEGAIGMFAVHPAMSGRGVGSKLFLSAEEHIRSIGMSSILLSVLSNSTGVIGMYERRGYRRVPNSEVDAKSVYSDPSRVLVPGLTYISLRKMLI